MNFMEAGQEVPEGANYGEEDSEQSLQEAQETEQDEFLAAVESPDQDNEPDSQDDSRSNDDVQERGSFVYGLSVGLGIGCIATFVIMWLTVFFTPQLPAVTYENMLSIFIYPLIYLLSVGLIALTAGIVKEYYTAKP
jgi:hypothetical protein